jgi:hypothetical protein
VRYIRLGVAGLVLLSSSPATLHAAAPPKPSCKKIRDAVWAGRTLEQITAEFDTDADTVMKCTQKRGKRKAAPKAKTQKTQKTKKSAPKASKSTRAPATTKSKSSQPSTRKPGSPRSGPWPAHLP